jgi:putative holliday junction resolvase
MNPILGIDFGQVRIGLAISDELQMLAHPLQTLPGNKEAKRRIAEIVRNRKIEKVVVGIPRHMSGEIGEAAKRALDFVADLRRDLPCPIETWDERLTTVAANRALAAAGKKTRQSRQFVDQVAAQMILQGYLDRAQAAVESQDPPNR